ncbi:MAG: VWA domain-containing protein [bacterium]|nr:VWA domain-containing protein [bacterium]
MKPGRVKTTGIFIFLLASIPLLFLSALDARSMTIKEIIKNGKVVKITYDKDDNCEIIYRVYAPGADRSKFPVKKGFTRDGWLDDYTYQVHASAMATRSLKNKRARRASARRAAILNAQYQILEKFKGSRIEGASGMSSFELSGTSMPEKVIRGKTSLKKAIGSGGFGSSSRSDKYDKSDDSPAPADLDIASEKRESSKSYRRKSYRRKPSGRKAYRRRSSGRQVSGLKAGFADDNKQFNYFVNFLQKYKNQAAHYPIKIRERITIQLRDNRGKPVPNARVRIFHKKKLLAEGATTSDGSFLFFPSEHGSRFKNYIAKITYMQGRKNIRFTRNGKRQIDISWKTKRIIPRKIPIDILFILDTTGSMGEEISRLKSTIELINLNLANSPSKPKTRFGMVLYKDKHDSYITKTIALTSNLDRFQKQLNRVTASGGGDTPEDLQSALSIAMRKIKWNKNGIRLAFIITDAAAHLDYGQKYNYVSAVKDARKKGIKIFSVGTGGLNIAGEYILRQIAQYSKGKYIFLTYGERGESKGGKPGSVSHHTGSNFTTGKLETIIIRFAKEELNNLLEKPLPTDDSYFKANKTDDEKNEEILQKLFDKAISQLIDFSSISIKKGTVASVVPITSPKNKDDKNSEYLTEQLIFSLAKNKTFKMAERKDLQKLLKEIELNMSGLTDEKKSAKIGKFLGADMLLVGTMFRRSKYHELFLKLVRVETGEIVSITKARIGFDLGLSK